MTQTLPILFDYLDFRRFLAEYQKTRYAADRGFSRVNLCRRLGLPRSRSYFTDVINGKKVTPTFCERLIEVFGFPAAEARYFRLLVKYDQAESADEKELYFDQLVTLTRHDSTRLEGDALAYYKEWYHSAVRAVLDVFDFGDDFATIGKALRPRISARQAKASIALLLRLDLIRKNGAGRYKPLPGTISTGLYAQDELIRGYQMQLLQLARDRIASKSGDGRSIITKLISVSAKGYDRIDRRLAAFMAEISAILQSDTDPADRVYHLDIQFFPGSRIRKDGVE